MEVPASPPTTNMSTAAIVVGEVFVVVTVAVTVVVKGVVNKVAGRVPIAVV